MSVRCSFRTWWTWLRHTLRSHPKIIAFLHETFEHSSMSHDVDLLSTMINMCVVFVIPDFNPTLTSRQGASDARSSWQGKNNNNSNAVWWITLYLLWSRIHYLKIHLVPSLLIYLTTFSTGRRVDLPKHFHCKIELLTMLSVHSSVKPTHTPLTWRVF